MKTKGAIIRQVPGRYETVELDLDEAGPGARLRSRHRVGSAVNLAGIHPGDTVIVMGVGGIDRTDLSLSIGELAIFQKRLQGSLFGASNPTADIPWLVDLYTRGQLKLDELITQRYTLDQVAQGYENMHAGKNIRGVVVYDD